MAINETISKGNKYRRLKDSVNKVWQRISFWTAASDVEFDNGQTAQEALGNITGITDSLTSNSSAVAASANAVSQLNSNLNSVSNARYVENGRINLYVGSDGKLHFVNRDGADTALNFNSGLKYYIGTWVDTNGERYEKIYVTVPSEATNWKFAYGYMQFQNDTPPTSYSPTATTSGTLLKCGRDSKGTYVETVYQRYNYGSYILFY